LITYAEYLRFVHEIGALPTETTRKDSPDEPRLAGWGRYQRRRLARGVLPGWQRELLEMVPGFSWDPSDDRWRHRREELSQFLVRHRRVPRYRAPDKRERVLAAWVHKQRHRMNQGRLPPHRVEALRRLPFHIV
jgi:hypothetical protein